MTIAQEKELIFKVTESSVKSMTKSMLDALIGQRLNELRTTLDSCNEKHVYAKLAKNISILEKAEEYEFYQKLLSQTEKVVRNRIIGLGESLQVNLINAEYFNFSGRF